MFIWKIFQIRIKIDALTVCMSRFFIPFATIFEHAIDLHLHTQSWFTFSKAKMPILFCVILLNLGDMKSHINRLIDINRNRLATVSHAFAIRCEYQRRFCKSKYVRSLKLKVTRFQWVWVMRLSNSYYEFSTNFVPVNGRKYPKKTRKLIAKSHFDEARTRTRMIYQLSVIYMKAYTLTHAHTHMLLQCQANGREFVTVRWQIFQATLTCTHIHKNDWQNQAKEREKFAPTNIIEIDARASYNFLLTCFNHIQMPTEKERRTLRLIIIYVSVGTCIRTENERKISSHHRKIVVKSTCPILSGHAKRTQFQWDGITNIM